MHDQILPLDVTPQGFGDLGRPDRGYLLRFFVDDANLVSDFAIAGR